MQATIQGDGSLAEATRFAARSLGWQAGGPDVIAVAPLAPTVAECDALIAQPAAGRRAFVWPTISVAAVQQMIVRCSGIGAVTNLSSRSTRPTGTGLLVAIHDQVAAILLLAQITGLGAPTGSSMRSPDVDGTVAPFDQLTVHFGDFRATAEVTWADVEPTLDLQIAGTDGVLRIETDPVTHLEHNGQPVPLPAPPPASAELTALHVTGVVGMLKSIEAGWTADRVLAPAYSFEFGRTVVALVEHAVRQRDL